MMASGGLYPTHYNVPAEKGTVGKTCETAVQHSATREHGHVARGSRVQLIGKTGAGYDNQDGSGGL